MTSGVALTVARYLESDEHSLKPPRYVLFLITKCISKDINVLFEAGHGF